MNNTIRKVLIASSVLALLTGLTLKLYEGSKILDSSLSNDELIVVNDMISNTLSGLWLLLSFVSCFGWFINKCRKTLLFKIPFVLNLIIISLPFSV